MKLTAKVILAYLGLGAGALGTYAAVNVFDNTQIEDVVDDYEDNDSEVVNAVEVETRSSSSEAASATVEEPKAPVVAAQTAPQSSSTVVTKPKASKPARPARRRRSKVQILQRVRDGGVKAWERFAELASRFVRGRLS